jgi:rhamnogalacturonan endolyase
MSKVNLKVNGNKCELSNGLISITFKEDASVESLVKNGTELIKDLDGTSNDSNAKRSFYVDYHAEGRFRKLFVSRLEVIENNEATAHVAYIDTRGLLYIEYHIILKKGESGIYTYIIASNNTDAEFSLGEFRTVYRFGNKIFDHACNSERIGLQPTHKYMEQFECLQDETFRLPDGEKYTNGDVYSKYDYSGYFSENPAWGQFGHGFGFFVIPVSTEYYSTGPLKQELLVHYDGIVLNYFTGAHFGTGSFNIPVGWKKFYGPFFVYINTGDDGEALYKDALEKAEIEKSKWPYKWVNHELYPLDRSTVSGILKLSDGRDCEGATVILAASGGSFERQKGGYIFYTETDNYGNFQLKNVRPGKYTLYVYSTTQNIAEQLEINDIEISKPSVDLGEILWQLSKRKKLWQLGKATRTCEGYKYGGELRNYKWSTMTPENLTFTIGESVESEDWYYAQVKPGEWTIKFNLKEEINTAAYLTVALAGVSKNNMTQKGEPYFTIKVNGVLVKEMTLINDSSIYRSATRSGLYRQAVIPVDSKILKSGENIITFNNENCMVMYDTVLMEI